MKINLRQIARLLPVLLFLVVFASQPARADVAPPPVPGLGGMQPFEYQDTQVQMIFERVEIELIPESWVREDEFIYPSDQDEYRVSAWFVMRNTGTQEEHMQVVFPLDNFNECFHHDDFPLPPTYTGRPFYREDSFEVHVDGEPLTVTQVTTEHPYHGQSFCDQYEMIWAGFNVIFPTGRDVLIRVSYVMDSTSVGDIGLESFSYVLETGGAWKGPIERGYVIFRFPGIADEEQVFEGTSPGYQILYNEVFWSFQNLEPTSEDNIYIVYIGANTWEEINEDRARIRRNPADVEAWIRLSNNYGDIAYWHADFVRSDAYAQKSEETLLAGLAANPESADLHAEYAGYLWNRNYPHGYIPPDERPEDVLAEIDLA
ncbi:MAG: hypothetical protein EHM70_23195, partial [Chloroflexota bacterium]